MSSIKIINDQIQANLNDDEREKVSDGYHTFEELYEHRHALFVTLCKSKPGISWKSRVHDDGSSFAGFFIAGMSLPSGMITYHLPDEHWDSLCIKELERAPAWDGHTSQDVVKRLREYEPSAKRGEDRMSENIRLAEEAGWTDIHGCPPNGAFCRGINPHTGRCEALPDF